MNQNQMESVDGNASALREERVAKTKTLIEEKGHPLHLFSSENQAFEQLLTLARNAMQVKALGEDILQEISEISIHYAKKGDLLYPLLKVRYEISGPSDVMWTMDDEIRGEFSDLIKAKNRDEAWHTRMEAVLDRMEAMIRTETNVLFPNCAANFTREEWIGIYFDQKDYPQCLGVPQENWQVAEQNKPASKASVTSQEIVMAGGHMTIEQLTALLNTIPMEITFVDADNINRFFNEGPKDFKRPQMAIDREVFSCHPPKVEAQVRRIIEEFRAGTLDELPIWMEKNGKCMLVKYMAVRDGNNQYLGTLELVQDMGFAKEHFLK